MGSNITDDELRSEDVARFIQDRIRTVSNDLGIIAAFLDIAQRTMNAEGLQFQGVQVALSRAQKAEDTIKELEAYCQSIINKE